MVEYVISGYIHLPEAVTLNTERGTVTPKQLSYLNATMLQNCLSPFK